MNKNTLTAILMGFIVCLGILVIVISIKLSIRPNVEDSSQTGKTTDEVVIETQPTATPTPVVTEAPQVPEVTTVIVTMVRTTETVNVRADSSVNGNKLGSAVKGSEFVMIEQLDNGWTKIEYEGGIAYIKSDYLEPFEKEVEVTVTPEATAPEGEADPNADVTAQ